MSFFGKGVGAPGWAVVSDTVQKQFAGFSSGLFNMLGNLFVDVTGSFDGALVFGAANAVVATLSYLLLTGKIQRLELAPVAT